MIRVSTEEDLAALAERAARSPRIAVDVEANGLFAYKASACVVQLAFEEGGRVEVAVIDARAVSPARLAPIFGGSGPIKVLHDLTLDARLLAAEGAPLANVRDTSVSARFLGFRSTGLASLLASELGVTIDKRFQQHDWCSRPLTDEQLSYLTADVEHLFALDDKLAAMAEALCIAPEIADECAYKLACALGPPKDDRPAYVRIKGAGHLAPEGRAVLRRLTIAREEVAAARGVPPFKVITNEVLLAIAQRAPKTYADLAEIRGATADEALAVALLGCVALGVADGDVPAADRDHFDVPKPSREHTAKRRAIEASISGWRGAEAKRRKVDEQVVLPGHCAEELANVLMEACRSCAGEPAKGADLRASIQAIPGLGGKRVALYLDVLARLGERR